MGRIFIYGDEAYDLGNIKHIDTTPFSGGYGGCYVNIHLLKGNEYVFNEDTGTTELIEPKIKKGFGEDRYAMSFIKTLCDTLTELTAKKELLKIFWTLFVHFKISCIFGQILTKWQQLKT